MYLDGKIKKRKFTLMEMVVVIMIIAALMAVATPLYFNHLKTARVKAAKLQVEMLDQAITTYRIDMKKLPDSLDDLVKNPGSSTKWKGPYVRGGAIPKDPWDNDYIYKKPGEHGDFDVISYGADGVPGGEDDNADVGNWTMLEN